MSEAVLYLGDCFDYLPTISDGSVDMVLTDMPYGTTMNDWDVKPDLGKLFDEFWRVCKPNAAVVCFSQMPFTAELVMACRKWFRYEWIWDKRCVTGFLNCNKMPLKRHENIVVFYKRLPTYNPQKSVGHAPYVALHKDSGSRNYGKFEPIPTVSSGERFPTDIIKFTNVNFVSKDHPTQKPVPLCEYLIKTYTNEGETVLDPFAGAGTTGVAAVNTGRKFVGCELMPKYFDVARERIDAAIAARLSEGGDACYKTTDTRN